MEELKNHLQGKPHIKKVYLNENNEWLFFPHPKFPNEVSREDILSEEEKAEEVKPKPKKAK